MTDRQKNIERGNAHRLAITLKQMAEDESIVKALAHYLHYNENQLKQDMKDIDSYIDRLESEGE